AMYAAKATGAQLMVYRADLDTRTVADLDLYGTVQAAFAAGGLVVHYQPKVHLASGATVGVEALARLRGPDGALLPPATFLPVLEQAGQLVHLTRQVLDLAVGEGARWLAAGHRVAVSVNVPAQVLVQADVATRVRVALDRHGLPGELLFLEVTEDSLLHDRVAGRTGLQAIRALGVRVSVDDYGTGWSSLTYLRELPLDEIKIDRSFVSGMAADPRATEIVRSTALLAHALGLTVVAEGVETEHDLAAVLDAGCDLAQGYLLSRPVPPEDVVGLLRRPAVPAPRPGQG
ncbi:MAG TPA: EAL domain-containing protein, partial [Actinotalea sp.]|nr:EAL domain-containing protein [Actinotalea sp.]